jgi:flagellum-specific ATP synthase
MKPDLAPYFDHLEQAVLAQVHGRVVDVIGLVVEGMGVDAPTGTICRIESNGSEEGIRAEVVGFRSNRILLMPYGEVRGIRPGARITPQGGRARAEVGDGLLGRVIDGLGQPLDGKGPLNCDRFYPLYGQGINPLDRPRITQPVDVGVRAINGLLTMGKGQRLGIFAGSGVGKSTLLSMIARNTAADVSVVGLIGERGREVKEFIDRDLGAEGLKRSVVVAATSDQPPLIRMRGAYLATTVAEYFRDQGRDVVLMVDSMTRFSMAGREVGLAVGEPPTTKGYTPSVFAHLPKILERAGTSKSGGSISGAYTVLVEGDDLNDPIADAMRSILDGHVVLTRQLAEQNHYPAVDVLKSVSRLMPDVVTPEHGASARAFRQLLAVYRRNEDLINIGAYVKGSNPEIDLALKMIPEINAYLRQPVGVPARLEEAVSKLSALMAESERPPELDEGKPAEAA